jgi:hypothetical protein
MSIETILIVLLIIWFLGGGFYGRGRWYGRSPGYAGPSFDPMMIVWIIVIVVIVGWLVGGGSLFYRH